jgi:hypothetical protein
MIEMATDGPPEFIRCDLQIRDRYIAALLASAQMDDGDVFTMWDWKRGECVIVSPYILCFIASLSIAASMRPPSAPIHFSIHAPLYWSCQGTIE